jgi:hypothetical protein
MQDADVVLSVLRERGSKNLPCTQLYRQMFNRSLYLKAYGNIYSNQGAMTPGADGETADGMSEDTIDQIIELMRSERYRFAPVRRVYIPKKNGKLRPLGLPSWSDKLVGEVVRLILEEVVEAFPTERADESFRDRIRLWSSGRGADDSDVGTGEHGGKVGSEFAVSVADQESEAVGAVAEIHEQVAGLLGDPDAGGMGGDPGEVHAATAVLDHDKDVEAAREDGVDVGEIDREDGVGSVCGGTVTRSGQPVVARDRGRRPSGSSRRSKRPRNGRVRPTHPESVGSPSGDSLGLSAAPGRGSAVRWVVGLGVGAGRSSGGQRAGCASARASGRHQPQLAQ